MRHDVPARRRLRALLRQPEATLDLAAAALCIAAEDQGVDGSDAALAELERLATLARPRLGSDAEAHTDVLNQLLFDELGFQGNTWDYTDPANSFLDRVLQRRAGLPILLSLVYLEVGWRLGLPLQGLALPGHFLVRYPLPDGELIVDPFAAGRRWSRVECAAQISAVYGSVTDGLLERFMLPPTKRAILVRILRNLKTSYLQREEWRLALACVDRLLLIAPVDVSELRDRGVLHLRLGRLHAAMEDFDRYARYAPSAADLPQIREQALVIARLLRQGN